MYCLNRLDEIPFSIFMAESKPLLTGILHGLLSCEALFPKGWWMNAFVHQIFTSLCTTYCALYFFGASELSEASLQCNAMFGLLGLDTEVVVEGKSNKVLVDCHIIDMTFGTRRFSLAPFMLGNAMSLG